MSNTVIDNVTGIRDMWVKNVNDVIVGVYCLFGPELKSQITQDLEAFLVGDLVDLTESIEFPFACKGVVYVETSLLTGTDLYIEAASTEERALELTQGVM